MKNMVALRRAEATWDDYLVRGVGRVIFKTKALQETAVRWVTRIEQPDGKTRALEIELNAGLSEYVKDSILSRRNLQLRFTDSFPFL
jgi:hypothetical protein